MTDTTEIKNEANGMDPDNSSNNPKLKTIKESLEQFESTQQNIKEIRKHINSIIDAIAQNRSILARAAQFWSKMPLWQKIGLGLLITVPILALAIAFNLFMLYVAFALTLATYIAGSYILDNHSEHEEKITDRLKDGMVDLADALESVIQSLDVLRDELSSEIGVMHEKNEHLEVKVTDLCTQVERLTEQGLKLKQTAQELVAIRLELEQKTVSLGENIEEQKELLRINEEELEQIHEEMNQNQEELSKTIGELAQVRKELGAEIKRVNTIASGLQKTVKEMSDEAITDEEQRLAFQAKLEEFIKNKEESFTKIADRIFATERELALVKDELNRNNKRNRDLLERQEKQIDRIEKTSAQCTSALPPKSAQMLKMLGLYASDENVYESPIVGEPVQAMTA
ncbi:LegC2/C7 family Dot/Icm T4SS effector [Legionella shakespearei]|uniref:Microtubule binding protein n=1 Tax=Legionella shakespearei DSM 23087 TaxID=1122169 RepID=A0A0W0Z776_9GAMM|nr:LegC2/C7 family Dot/Icm T4SS effector [Legionella shakespearei]KTD64970.1 microtubule binding protein [Legionella shakespearei DSM 23087]